MNVCGKKYNFRPGMIKRCERPKKHRGDHGPFRARLQDQFGNKLRRDNEVIFISDTGSRRLGIVKGRDLVDFARVSVIIEGDPFPVGILPANLIKKGYDKMPATQVKTDKKALRSEAKKLKISDYKEMTVKELKAAIKAASNNGSGKVSGTHKVPRGQTKVDKGKPVKPSEKKAAKKTAAKTKEAASNGNPFRPGSNNFYITEEFIKGGNRAKMIQRLLKKIKFRPYARKEKDLDPAFEMDKRIMMAAHQLQHKHNFTIVHVGRGAEKSTIRAFPPGVKVPAELKAKATKINKPGDPIRTPKRTKKAVKSSRKSPGAATNARKASKKAPSTKTAAKSRKSTKKAKAKK